MNTKTKNATLGISIAVLFAVSIITVNGFQDAAAADKLSKELEKFAKKFEKPSDKVHFIAKMDTAQIPDVHRLFEDRGNTGVGKFQFNEELSKLEYSLRFDGLTLEQEKENSITKIHFHQADLNTPGPHVLNVFGAPCEPDLEMSFLSATRTLTGAWDDNDDLREDSICELSDGPASESLTEKLEALCNGELYTNIHSSYAVTDAGDNGEIRGQIIPTKQGEKICEELGF